MKLASCRQCGAEFQKINKSLHCSKQCSAKGRKAYCTGYKKAHRPPLGPLVACGICGVDFHRRSVKYIYCGDTCYEESKRVRSRKVGKQLRAARPKALPLPKVTCNQCGLEFQPKVRRANRCMCSSACAAAYRKNTYNQYLVHQRKFRGPKREFCKCGCRGPLDGAYRPGIDYLLGHTPANRMARTSTHPSKPELILHAALKPHGFDYVGCTPPKSLGLPLSADIISMEHRILVMVDGCYWHECPVHGTGRFPEKVKRDAEKRAHARSLGWTVVSVWEHDIVCGDKPALRLDDVVHHVVSYIETSDLRVPQP